MGLTVTGRRLLLAPALILAIAVLSLARRYIAQDLVKVLNMIFVCIVCCFSWRGGRGVVGKISLLGDSGSGRSYDGPLPSTPSLKPKSRTLNPKLYLLNPQN